MENLLVIRNGTLADTNTTKKAKPCIACMVPLLLLVPMMMCADSGTCKDNKEKSLNFEITTGLQGQFCFAQVEVNLPQFIDHFFDWNLSSWDEFNDMDDFYR